MNTFDKVLRFTTEKMAYGAIIAIVVCVGLVVSDIIKRSIGFAMIPGVPETVELISSVILSMGIPYLTFVKGHVAVGILVDRFRPRNQAVFVLVTSVIALAFAILLTRGLFDHAIYNQRIGWTTGYLKIPRHPFIYLTAVSMALTSVVLIRDLLKAVITLRKGGEA